MPDYGVIMSSSRLIVAVIVLAGLDLAGSLLLKEAALRRAPTLAIAGAGVFVVLALVLFVTLETAELTVVNLGWIVLLQAAVMAVDGLRYGYAPGRVQAIAIAVAMVALVVAILAPPAEQATAAPPVPGPRSPADDVGSPGSREDEQVMAPGPLERRLQERMRARHRA